MMANVRNIGNLNMNLPNTTGAMGICFPYLGEFQPTQYRERILSWMELFWTAGIIMLPLIAWLIIPLPLRYQGSFIDVHSWNVFVAICSLLSLLLAAWLTQFPESPKYLLESGEYDKSMDVLRHMYAVNTGDSPGSYPVCSLQKKVQDLSETILASRNVKSVRTPKDVKILLSDTWRMTKLLFRPPHFKPMMLTSLIQFGLTCGYYTFAMWFPELFYRFQKFEQIHPNHSSSICEVSSVFLSEGTVCDSTIDSSVYRNTLIIGLACIPTSIWLPLCISRLGTKFFLVFCLVVPGCVTLGLYFVQNSWQNLVLSCVFEALTGIAISMVYCVLVDLFPTNLRVMATALSLTIGRTGALFGNLLFGFLIDFNCIVPVVTFSFFLIVSGILCLFLPKTGHTVLE